MWLEFSSSCLKPRSSPSGRLPLRGNAPESMQVYLALCLLLSRAISDSMAFRFRLPRYRFKAQPINEFFTIDGSTFWAIVTVIVPPEFLRVHSTRLRLTANQCGITTTRLTFPGSPCGTFT